MTHQSPAQRPFFIAWPPIPPRSAAKIKLVATWIVIVTIALAVLAAMQIQARAQQLRRARAGHSGQVRAGLDVQRLGEGVVAELSPETEWREVA